MYNYILKTVESLTTEQLEDRLCDLIKASKLENKPHSGKNLFYCRKRRKHFSKGNIPTTRCCFSRRNTHQVTRPYRYKYHNFPN